MNRVDTLLTAIGLKTPVPEDEKRKFLRAVAGKRGFKISDSDREALKKEAATAERALASINAHGTPQALAHFNAQTAAYHTALEKGEPPAPLQTRDDIEKVFELHANVAKTVRRNALTNLRDLARPIGTRFAAELRQEAQEVEALEKNIWQPYGLAFEPGPLVDRLKAAAVEVERLPDCESNLPAMLPFLSFE